MPSAKLRAKVDRYSFFVRLLPPLLHTGLTRRTNIAITLKSRPSGSSPSESPASSAAFPVESQAMGWMREFVKEESKHIRLRCIARNSFSRGPARNSQHASG
jgi:hypothetical protein